MEQRLVWRPPHPRLQRAVPGGFGGAHPPARGRARRHRDRGAVRAAGSPAFRSRAPGSGRWRSGPPRRSTSTPGGWPWPSARCPALGAVVALDRDLPLAAAGLALLSALCSPVAALFAAVAAAGYALAAALTHRRAAGRPPGRRPPLSRRWRRCWRWRWRSPRAEPSRLSCGTLLPVLVDLRRRAARRHRARRRRCAPGSPCTRWPCSRSTSSPPRSAATSPAWARCWPPRWRRCCGGGGGPLLLALCALPLLYVGWQAPVADVSALAGDPSHERRLLPAAAALPRGPAGRPRARLPHRDPVHELPLGGLPRRPTSFPLARGWERQLDRADNPLFYGGRLTAARYERWLHDNAIRFVALPDAALDSSAGARRRSSEAGQPYLRLVMRSAHWRVYAVAHPTPIAQGSAALRAMGSDWVALEARRARGR